MLLLMQRLGKEYEVWDKSANIECIKATGKAVHSVLRTSNEELADMQNARCHPE